MIEGMVDLIKEISELGLGTTMLGFFLALSALVGVKAGIKKFKEIFGLVDAKELEHRELLGRISTLEEKVKEVDKRVTDTSTMYDNKLEGFHQQSIQIRGDLAHKQDETNSKVDSLTTMFEQFMNKEDETTVAMFRSSLWRLHRDFTQQGFVTPDGLKTFMEMGRVYTAAGGNDIYHEKLLPEVEALEIRYPDGGVYK